MNKRGFLYIPLVVLFILSAIVYVQHAAPVVSSLNRMLFHSSWVRYPFELQRGKIVELLPEAEAAGLQKGDALIGIGGHVLEDDDSARAELNKFRPGDTVVYTVDRIGAGGSTVRQDIPVIGVALSMTFGQAFRDVAITFLFLLCLPGLSFLLGFYVAFVRPRDPIAWLLLGMLLGIGSIGIEGSREGTFTKAFQETALNTLGICMLLFGIYFPERLGFDRRFPWVKWMLIVPLAINALLNSLEQFGRFLQLPALWKPIDTLTKPYDSVGAILAMMGVGGFFAAIAAKSSMLENRDSRRRLKMLYFGTSAALLPSLFIIIYRIVSGKSGGFFQLVPSWLAVTALLAMLLFPLTMAYVIVVQRAMDVRVAIRQGLQYALAKNGIRVLQALLLIVVVVITVSTVRNFGENLLVQIGFVAAGLALIPVIDYAARKLRIWIDRRFFREAYDAEKILSDLSEDVRTMVETKPLLETVAAKISESLHVPQIALLLRRDESFIPAHSIGFDTRPVVAFNGDSLSIRKLANDRIIVLYDDMTEVTSTPTVSLSDREQLAELNSQLLLPVAVRNRLSGIISLSPKLSEEPYTASDLRLLRSVAAQTGIALENSRLTEAVAAEAAQKERLNTELEIAREVQERLFPQEFPKIAGLDLYGACRPALGVGGDYYDFLELSSGKLGIAIGDISGKGIGASLMMASLQASLRGQAIHFKEDLAGLMAQINSLVYEASTTNRYATFFYAQFDPANRALSYVNAGHNPPFLIRANGEVLRLEVGGAVVGMLPPMLVEYSMGEIRLEIGDLLVGYTDGISEAMNLDEEEWGEEAMLETLKNLAENSANELLHLVVTAADKFANGAKQHDDMTMIVVKVVS